MSQATRPDFIGCYDVAGERHFYGATSSEIDRAAFTISRVLRTYAFPAGSNILTISMVPEIIQYGSFERAVQMLGMYGLNADDSPFEAGRVESISRQFSPVAICGVAKSTLDGLAMIGHDPVKVFAGKVVWARPEAYDAVKALGGCVARRTVSVGPMFALECADGALHYDDRDWLVEDRGGALHLTSRMHRVEPLDGLDTGFRGAVSSAACACGVRDAVISVD